MLILSVFILETGLLENSAGRDRFSKRDTLRLHTPRTLYGTGGGGGATLWRQLSQELLPEGPPGSVRAFGRETGAVGDTLCAPLAVVLGPAWAQPRAVCLCACTSTVSWLVCSGSLPPRYPGLCHFWSLLC